MHMHRVEKWWLTAGSAMIVIFLVVIGFSAFAAGMQPPSAEHQMIDPAKVRETAPFDHPGLKQIAANEYELDMIAYVFGYDPAKIDIPKGAVVHFKVTSTDVVHGFEIAGTNVNMMIVPGEISTFTYTFNNAGEFLLLCNEYCGSGHQVMKAIINVKD